MMSGRKSGSSGRERRRKERRTLATYGRTGAGTMNKNIVSGEIKKMRLRSQLCAGASAAPLVCFLTRQRDPLIRVTAL